MSQADPKRTHTQEFVTTRWSLVLEAAQHPTQKSTEALETLCRTYWYPLYAYARRRGYSVEDAQDLTQGFFARLLEKNYLKEVRRERGRFRSFLLASLKHYMANEWDRAQTLKRGGGQTLISLDGAAAEKLYRLEPSSDLTPEKIFDRRWALTLLDRALTRLCEEFSGAGKAKQFHSLKVFLTGETPPVSYDQITEELAMTMGAVKNAVHRMRRAFRLALREEIARTIVKPEDIDDELQRLFAALRP